MCSKTQREQARARIRKQKNDPQSDLGRDRQGFRDTNQWLAVLTNNAFPVTFYAGDALGSFESWARIITGLLPDLGIVGLVFPHMETCFGKH